MIRIWVWSSDMDAVVWNCARVISLPSVGTLKQTNGVFMTAGICWNASLKTFHRLTGVYAEATWRKVSSDFFFFFDKIKIKKAAVLFLTQTDRWQSLRSSLDSSALMPEYKGRSLQLLLNPWQVQAQVCVEQSLPLKWLGPNWSGVGM